MPWKSPLRIPTRLTTQSLPATAALTLSESRDVGGDELDLADRGERLEEIGAARFALGDAQPGARPEQRLGGVAAEKAAAAEQGDNALCPGGGIGRRTSFRCWRSQGRGGSSPLLGTTFDRACEAAHLFGARRIRSVVWERAIEGTLKGRYYRGELVAEERVYDNRLLTYLYGKVAHLLEPTSESRRICGRWEAHMDALEQGLEELAPPKPVRPDFTGYEVREDDEGVWWTSFPPPADFDGEEQGEFGEEGYRRTLSDREQAVLDAGYDRDDAEHRAVEAARRDRFFGFAGNEVSSPGEAEPYGTSEPSEAVDPDSRPIEYKSLVPPSPTRNPSFRRIEQVHSAPHCVATSGGRGDLLKEPMNTAVRRFHRLRSWIPDQVRDDGQGPGHIQTARLRHP
jgi:hypothetical protein